MLELLKFEEAGFKIKWAGYSRKQALKLRSRAQTKEMEKKVNYKEISYKNEEEWHSIRQKHIGGSDVSVIMGYNEYKNLVTLWEEKTGRREQEDLSDNKAIQRGKLSENLLIEHFKTLIIL